jgi:hypothetical protein
MTNAPSEPTSLALMVTGLGTIGLYLLVSGQWKYLRYYATGGRFGLSPKSASRVHVSPSYRFCGYEQRFTYSLSVIASHLGDAGVRQATGT